MTDSCEKANDELKVTEEVFEPSLNDLKNRIPKERKKYGRSKQKNKKRGILQNGFDDTEDKIELTSQVEIEVDGGGDNHSRNSECNDLNQQPSTKVMAIPTSTTIYEAISPPTVMSTAHQLQLKTKLNQMHVSNSFMSPHSQSIPCGRFPGPTPPHHYYPFAPLPPPPQFCGRYPRCGPIPRHPRYSLVDFSPFSCFPPPHTQFEHESNQVHYSQPIPETSFVHQQKERLEQISNEEKTEHEEVNENDCQHVEIDDNKIAEDVNNETGNNEAFATLSTKTETTTAHAVTNPDDQRFSFRQFLLDENEQTQSQNNSFPQTGVQIPQQPKRFSKIQNSIDALNRPIMPTPSFVYRQLYDYDSHHNQSDEKPKQGKDGYEIEILERQQTILKILESDADRETVKYDLDTLMVTYIEYILLDTKSILNRPAQDIVRHFSASIYDEIKCMQKLLTGKSMHMTHRMRQFLSVHNISFDSLMKLTQKIQMASSLPSFSSKQQYYGTDQRKLYSSSLPGLIPKRHSDSKKLLKKRKNALRMGEFESVDSTTDSEIELRCGIPPSENSSDLSERHHCSPSRKKSRRKHMDLHRLMTEEAETAADNLVELEQETAAVHSSNAVVMVDDPVLAADVAADVVVGTESNAHHLSDNLQILTPDIAEHIFSSDQIEMLTEQASMLFKNDDSSPGFVIDEKQGERDYSEDDNEDNRDQIRRERRAKKKASKREAREKKRHRK